MSKMSGSQKFIYIVSILNIIGGAAYLLFGILAALGVGITGTERLVQETGEQQAGAYAIIFIVILVALGAFSLITGILGVRAAHDASKINPVFILAAISLIISVISLIMAITEKKFSATTLASVVGPALMLWCANNVKKQTNL